MRRDDPQSGKRYFRSGDRIFQANGAWYFAAREGDQGPFASPELALREVDSYASAMRDLAGFQRSRDLRDAQSGARTVVPLPISRGVLARAQSDELEILI